MGFVQCRTCQWSVHSLHRLSFTYCEQDIASHIINLIGTLLTLVQFLFVAATSYVSQFDYSRPPLFLTPNHVPIRRWLVNVVLFFCVNVLNNHAFSYSISVPVHIILRSGGSITTMLAGSIWGKKYTRTQIIAVHLLTIGVVVAAWSDAQVKVRPLCLCHASGY
jgi:UDP-xylose/UDP-N-acetylglucosamine transporter B4